MKLALAAFLYNRPDHAKAMLADLAYADESHELDIHIFIDGARSDRDTQAVRETIAIAEACPGFKSKHIHISKINYGLAKSVIKGVTLVLESYDGILVFEDDLRCAPETLVFLKTALHKYKDKATVQSVTAYNYPPSWTKIPDNYPYDGYFHLRPCSWAWATWKDRWKNASWEIESSHDIFHCRYTQMMFNRAGDDMFEMLKKQVDGHIDSWAIRWCFDAFIKGQFALFPCNSFVTNHGMDGTGTHGGNKSDMHQQVLNQQSIDSFRMPEFIALDDRIMKSFRRPLSKNPFRRIPAKALIKWC